MRGGGGGGGGNFFEKKSVVEGQKFCFRGGLIFRKAVRPWLGKGSQRIFRENKIYIITV